MACNPGVAPTPDYAADGGAKPGAAGYGGGCGYDVEEGGVPAEELTGVGESATRRAFLVKVYSILVIQLMWTIGIVCLSIFVVPIREFFFNNYWMWIIFFVCVIISIFVTIAVRKKHPWNLVSLGVLTTLEGFLLGVICAMYYSIGWGDTILLALVLTTSVFVFITAFCFATRIDFSFLYAFLAGAIFVVFIAAMAVLVAGWVGAYNKWASFGISVAFALVMMGYILYDTSRILLKLSVDEYIEAAVSLYTDFASLFLAFLGVASIAN